MNNNKENFEKSVRWFTRTRVLLIMIVLQVLFLSGLTLSYYMVEWVGKDIKLQTAPLDPRDLYHGDYVTLNYKISSLPLSQWKGKEAAERGDAVYVVLKQDNGVYGAIAAYPDRPDLNSDEVLLKGKVDYSMGDTIRIRYGLERYYVPESTGKALEEKSKNMIVHVKIAPWGQVKISWLED